MEARVETSYPAPPSFAPDSGLTSIDLRFWKYARAVLLRQIEVTEIERVLGTESATHHATAACNARGSVRPFSSEERVGDGVVDGISIRSLENTYLGGVEGGAASDGIGSSL